MQAARPKGRSSAQLWIATLPFLLLRSRAPLIRPTGLLSSRCALCYRRLLAKGTLVAPVQKDKAAEGGLPERAQEHKTLAGSLPQGLRTALGLSMGQPVGHLKPSMEKGQTGHRIACCIPGDCGCCDSCCPRGLYRCKLELICQNCSKVVHICKLMLSLQYILPPCYRGGWCDAYLHKLAIRIVKSRIQSTLLCKMSVSGTVQVMRQARWTPCWDLERSCPSHSSSSQQLPYSSPYLRLWPVSTGQVGMEPARAPLLPPAFASVPSEAPGAGLFRAAQMPMHPAAANPMAIHLYQALMAASYDGCRRSAPHARRCPAGFLPWHSDSDSVAPTCTA